MSDQPSGRLPQPRASAMGFHMAMTTGDKTKLSVLPIKSLPVLARDSALPSLIKAADAGLAKCAWSCPERILSTVSPEPMGMARTKMVFPFGVLVLLRLNAAVTSAIHFSFSEPYGNTSSSAPRGAEFDVSLAGTEGLWQAESKKVRATRKTVSQARGGGTGVSRCRNGLERARRLEEISKIRASRPIEKFA